MILDHLFTRTLFESQTDHITQFASNAHEEWRRNFDPTGTKPRIKKNSDGTEGDINVPFADLHPDWQKENLAAAHAAHRAVKHFGRDMEKAAEYVHNEWMKRNPKADYNAAQHVPYDDLPQDEKEKDRVHVRTMMQLMGHSPEQGVAEGLNDTQKKIEDTINKLEDRLKHAKTPEQWDNIKNRIERLQAGLKRSKQGVAEAFPNPGSGSTGSSKEDKRIAAALRKKHIHTTPNDKKKQGVAEGDVVQFPQKHPWYAAKTCPKCEGLLVGGKTADGRVKYCMGCGAVYPEPNTNKGVAEGLLGSDPNRGQKVPGWAKGGIIGKIGRKLDPAWSDIQMTVPQHLLSKQSSVPDKKSLATKDMPKAKATSITPTRAIPKRAGTNPSHPVTKNVVKTIADKSGVAEGSDRIDSLVTDALKIMRGPEMSDAVLALKRVLGDRAYNERRGFYSFYVDKIHHMYGQRGMAENNHWHAAGVADAQRDVKRDPNRKVKTLNPRTRLKTMQDKQARHPEEVEQYSQGYRSVKQGVAESNTLMKKLHQALLKEGRVKELADDLKTLNDAEFMKKYGKAKAAIRRDMKKVDEGNANSGRRGPNSPPDNTPVKLGRVQKLKTGIKHHADSSRYGGTVPDTDDDHLLSLASRHRLHKAVTPDHDMDEARMSAAQRLSNAWDKQRAKSNASLARTPSSIPKKQEPEPQEKQVAKKIDESRRDRQALMAQIANGR